MDETLIMSWHFLNLSHTYFWQDDEKHLKEEVAAVWFLVDMCLILVVDKLAFEFVPNRPLVDVVQPHTQVECKDEGL